MATGFITNIKGDQGIQGPIGPIGLPGVNAVANDTATAGYVATPSSETRGALTAAFQRKTAFNPDDFGALVSATDNTAAFQACINAAGLYGAVEFSGEYKVAGTLTLMDGTEIRGTGTKASSIINTADVPTIYIEGGQGQTVRNLRIRSTVTGIRTSPNIDVVNPTKPAFIDIEIDLPNASLGFGGLSFREDSTKPGNNEFMPDLRNVWIRNGLLRSVGVTDGHVSGGWIWAPYHDARAAVDLVSSNGWTFVGVDVASTTVAGCGYRLENTKQTNIVGGYLDGGYSYINSGHGIIGVNASTLQVTGTHFFNHGRSGVRLVDSHACTFTGVGFYQNNKQNGAWPDVDLYNSWGNNFIGTTHSQPRDVTSKGIVLREDAASKHNLFDAASVDLLDGNFYGTPLFSGNAGTLGRANRPVSLWPRPSTVPNFIAPPACFVSLGTATVWPAANRAQFHRFAVTETGSYRYANLRVEVASGTIQAAVVAMDGLNYTRVMNSGLVTVVAGTMNLDMAATILPAGEYALVVWVSNITAQVRLVNDEQVRSSRMAAEVDMTAAGVPASGSIAGWSSPRAVTGATLTA